MSLAHRAYAINIPTPSREVITIANDAPLTIIAGPCMMESRDHALYTADYLQNIAQRLGVCLIYKTSFDKANRTSAKSARGVGLDQALEIFSDIRTQTGLTCITDVHTSAQCAPLAEIVDMLQIPAFLCRQTDLLEAAAATLRPINVKKGQFLSPYDMENVIDKIRTAGNPNVLACERGVSFGYNRLVNDFRSLPIMKSFGVPVVFDATHSVQQPGGQGEKSGGERQFVWPLARAACAIGVAAVFIETHQDPDNAPSDGPNMIPLDNLEDMLRDICAFDKLCKSQPSLPVL